MAGVKDKNCELVAKRWALALMELALEDENISKEDILDDLHEISETINSSEELSNVINNPSISTEEKQIVICAGARVSLKTNRQSSALRISSTSAALKLTPSVVLPDFRITFFNPSRRSSVA